VKYGAERLIVELLNFLDTFDLALQLPLTNENAGQFKQGIEMTAAELRNVLNRFGVQELDPNGKAFNPAEHEALSSEETDKVEPGHVSRVFKKAYKLHDRVIRPAQVVVAKELAPKEG
jgi:molecular chaperone GrpE